MNPPPSPQPMLPALVERRPGGRFRVTCAEALLGETTSQTQAVSLLCHEAIRRSEPVLVTVRKGGAVKHLGISVRGHVTEVAAPPPSTDALAPAGSARRDLGHSPDAEVNTQIWVQDAILDPAPAGQSATPRGKRPRLRLRRG